MILLLRPIIKKISKLNNLSSGFKLTFITMFFCFVMLFIGIYNMFGLSSDYTKITMIPKSNIYSHELWAIKNTMIIQNHPIIFFVVAVMISIIVLFTLMITIYKNELMMIQNMIEKKSMELLYGNT